MAKPQLPEDGSGESAHSGRQRRLADLDAWFAAMDRHGDIPFMEDGRDQPRLPADPKRL